MGTDLEGEVTERLPDYWLWEKGLSDELCDLILKDPAWGDKHEAAIGGHINGQQANIMDKTARDSSIAAAPTNHWLEGFLYNSGLYAVEQAGWGFSMGRPQQVQLTEYRPGQHYDQHMDTDVFSPTLYVRKVSIVALLSDPKDFEGGEFVFGNGVPIPLIRGSVLAFPSLCLHQVKPVTAGVRRSAVCWIVGPR